MPAIKVVMSIFNSSSNSTTSTPCSRDFLSVMRSKVATARCRVVAENCGASASQASISGSPLGRCGKLGLELGIGVPDCTASRE